MQAAVAAIVELILIGLALGIITGQIKPEELLKRLLWLVVLIVAAGFITCLLHEIAIASIPALQSFLGLMAKWFALLVLVVIVGAVIAALVQRCVLYLLKRS